MAETVNERIQYIVKEYYDGNVSAFAKTIGSTPPVIRDIIKGRLNSPSLDTITKIINAVAPEINERWLILGTPPILKSENRPRATFDFGNIGRDLNNASDNSRIETDSVNQKLLSELQKCREERENLMLENGKLKDKIISLLDNK